MFALKARCASSGCLFSPIVITVSLPQAERETLNDHDRLNHALTEALDWEVTEELTVLGESRKYHPLEDANRNLETKR